MVKKCPLVCFCSAHLVTALGWFFSQRAHWNEGLDWLERMLATNPDASASLRAAYRNKFTADAQNAYVGFRAARPV